MISGSGCGLCTRAEVAKLRIERRTSGDMVELRAAAAATGGFGALSAPPEWEPDLPSPYQDTPSRQET